MKNKITILSILTIVFATVALVFFSEVQIPAELVKALLVLVLILSFHFVGKPSKQKQS